MMKPQSEPATAAPPPVAPGDKSPARARAPRAGRIHAATGNDGRGSRANGPYTVIVALNAQLLHRSLK